jgi:hypothetical protein
MESMATIFSGRSRVEIVRAAQRVVASLERLYGEAHAHPIELLRSAMLDPMGVTPAQKLLLRTLAWPGFQRVRRRDARALLAGLDGYNMYVATRLRYGLRSLWRSGKLRSAKKPEGLIEAVYVYPQDPRGRPRRNELAAALIHEAAHGLAVSRFGMNDSKKPWRAWRAAIRSDVLAPSGYARVQRAEDFAELAVLYATVRGKHDAVEVARAMPARWQLFERLLQR